MPRLSLHGLSFGGRLRHRGSPKLCSMPGPSRVVPAARRGAQRPLALGPAALPASLPRPDRARGCCSSCSRRRARWSFRWRCAALIDEGFIGADPGARVMALREHFVALFGVGVALGLFSAPRFYMVSWLGERVTADLRNAVYSHVVRQSPEFFETTQTGEVLSRLTTDTTLVQTVVGSSLSMGLRNAVMGVGAMAMLIVTNPVVMTQVLAILVLVVLPTVYVGRRVRRLSRASQDRVADSSAIAAEVLNAMPVVQSYLQEDREAQRFGASTERAFSTAVRRTTHALVHGRLHHQRHLRRPALGPVPGHAGGAARRHQRRPPRPDGGLRDHPGGQRRGAVGGVRRPAARRRRDRAADGAPATCARRSSRRRRRRPLPARRGGASVELDDVTFRYPSRPQHPTLAALQPEGRARRDGRPGRPERRRQEHRVPADPALLRRRVRRGADRRRPGRARRPRGAARADRHRPAGQRDLLDRRDGEHPLRPARGQRRRGRSPPRPRPTPTTSSPPCPRATRPSSASAASASRAASASASRSPARCSRIRRCSSSTRPPARSTPKASAWSRPRSSRRCATAPPSSSPTASRPCRGPTGSSSWKPARSSRPGRTRELLAAGGLYSRLAALQFDR